MRRERAPFARWCVVVGVLGIAVGCGARSSLRVEAGEGGAAVTSGASSTSGAGGCTPTVLEAGSPGVEYLVADGERVFYSTRDHRVMAGDLDSGETQLLATPSAMALANAVTAFGDDVFFADDNVVWRVPKEGGDVVAITEKIPQLFNLTADATGIYWTQAGGPSAARDIVRMRPDGSRVTIAEHQYGVYGLVPSPSGLVFTTQSDASTVQIASIDGSGTKVLAEGLPPARFPFVWSDHVYWVEDDDAGKKGFGAVARVALDGSGYERVLVESDPVAQTTRAITDGTHFFVARVDTANRVLAGAFPIASTLVPVFESPLLVSAYSLVLTPKRLVFTTVDPGTGARVEASIQSRCRADLALP